MPQPLTPPQEKVLGILSSFRREKGYIPSFRELARACGFKSLNTVHFHLKALKEKGYVQYPPYRSRAVHLVGESGAGLRSLPILGAVAAGSPSLAVEEHEETIEVDSSLAQGPCFALRVKGDSMKDAGILPGDIAIVRRQSSARNGDIVVARFDDEATVKVLKSIRGSAFLVPANESYLPIPAREAELIGVVTGIIRRYG